MLLELAFQQLGLHLVVSNRGYNGGKTADIVYGSNEVSPAWMNIDAVLAEDKPTIVVLLMGTNDVIVQRDAATVEVSWLVAHHCGLVNWLFTHVFSVAY